MRFDNLAFKRAAQAPGKEPRFVVSILFDVASIYVTSHAGIANVPGIVLQAALKRPSAISQRLVPDEGRSEIGTFSFELVDLNSDFTDEVRAKLAAGKGLRGKVVQLWVGFRGFDFSAFQLFQTQIITDCEYDAGAYAITCQDITRQQRTDVFDLKSTTLTTTCDATTGTINVADTTNFLAVAHGAAWSDSPSSTVYYFKIDKEIIRATGKTPTTFTGCSRGQFNTAPATHTVDPASPQERRPKVEEFMYLDLPAPKLALAIMTGAILNNYPANLLASQGSMQTDSNADGAADGWSKFVGGAGDGARVYTASLVAGSSPFSGNAQRLINTSVTNANDSGMEWQGDCRSGITFTASCHIRTNATGKVTLTIRFMDAAGASTGDFVSSFVVGDSIAHLAQITGLAPARTHRVAIYVRGINANAEFFEFDNVMMEIGSTVHTFTSTAIEGLLPQHWHTGIAPEFVRFADFTGIGTDLWDLASDFNGFTTRFEGLAKQDGKRFLERELFLLLGAYSPVYSDGSVGLKRLPAMVSDAATVATLTERELTSISALRHSYDKLHNQIRVTWGYDIGVGRFTRDTLFIDAQSVSINGVAPVIEYQFRGLHSGIHTENMIRKRLDAVRDAYSYPPQETSVSCMGSLNCYETGDVFRLKVRNVRDFVGSTTDIDRSFLATRRSIDFVTGEVQFELFGSTLRPQALPPSTEVTAPLPDAYYTAVGVALSTVVGMTGNSVNAGVHTITGNASMTAAAAVVFHNGDLVVPSGATINISANVQLRVKGFITLNGIINGLAGGMAATSDPGTPPLLLIDTIAGTPGFMGNSRGWDGIDIVSITKGTMLTTIAAALTRGRYEAWPDLNLEVVGNTLLGIPSDMRGTGGGPGGRIISTPTSATFAGGAGGAGGAGMSIICRGISFGVSASINLSGAGTASPGVNVAGKAPFEGLYRGAGGAGAPGALLIILDGNNLLFPNAAGHFVGKTGFIDQPGVPMTSRSMKIDAAVKAEGMPKAGYADEQIISDRDQSVANLKIQYVPFTQMPATDQNRLPAPITALTLVGDVGANIVRATLPAAESFDLLEYYAAVSNNRAGAVLIARGRISEFRHVLPAQTTRFYWARTTRTTDAGLELFSDWFPVSSTGGVSGSTLADPDSLFFEGWETPWESKWVDYGSSGSLVTSYPANGILGGKVLRAQNQIAIVLTENIPFDPNALYRISTKIRRTTASGAGAGTERVYCGVAGVAADGVTLVNDSGANSMLSQFYNCANAFDMSTVAVGTWRDFVGYFKGLASSGVSGVAANVDSPTKLYTGVTYFRPLLIMNDSLGNGTMENDDIIVERLVVPDDADNSAKNRIVPDQEFSRATDASYWWKYNPSGGAAATITTSGGAVAGYATIPGAGALVPVYIVSRRALPYQCATGELYTVTIRARVPGFLIGFLTADLIRHARASSNSTFAPAPAGGLAGVALGGIDIDGGSIGTDWTEYSGLCFVRGVSGLAGKDLPYLSAIVGTQLASSGSVDVDMVSVVPGQAVQPAIFAFTSSLNLGTSTSPYFKNHQYDSAAPGTLTLPTAVAEHIGGRIYFEQMNTGALSIAVQGGDTLQTFPNTTGTRALGGRYGRGYAEVMAATIWRAFGDF